MPTPIALQLYSVREDLARDFRGTLEKIAAIGFTGVETAGFPEGITAQKAKQIFDELGLTVVSAHSPLPLDEQQDQVLETMHTLACPHLISPWMTPDLYKSAETIRDVAEIFNRVYAICAAHGLKFSIHNHDFEFQLVDDIPALSILSRYLDPGITFELDTYWIHVAGQDPAHVVSEFGARAPLLHIKDGPGVRGEPMLALGEGVVNIPAIVKAGGDHTEWLIIELDACATDMLEAVEKSYRYLSQVDR